MPGSILGGAVKRVEDPRFITGRGDYIFNRPLEGAAWMVPVRSQVPHGRLVSIDLEEARSMPGVVGVFTAGDLEGGPLPIQYTGQPETTRRPLIASDTVRFAGDIVTVVVAETQPQAVDAAEAVWVEIDPLPVVADVEAAAAADAPLLYPELGTNLVHEGGLEATGDALERAEVVVSGRIVHQRLAAVPLEPNNAVCLPTDAGLELWVGAQNVFEHRNIVSKALGIDRDLLRVVVPDMGGGFGAKIPTYPEQVLVAALARLLDRPIRWQELRRENMVAMTHGRAAIHQASLGARADGEITGLRISVLQDAGAYPMFGAALPSFTQRMAAGPYLVPRIEFTFRSYVTNTTPVDAYRGAGRPEATATLERLVDLLARRLDLDPAEVRRRNLVPLERFPHTSPTGERYDSGDYRTALDLALRHAGYDRLRREQAERRESGDRVQLGIGVSCYVEVTAPVNRKDWGSVEVGRDGSVTVASGSSSHGHGHETTFAQIAAHILGVPIDRVTVVQGDSARVVRGGGTMGSRSLQMGGTAVLHSAETVLDQARRLAAHLSEASVEDVVLLEDGRIGVAGVPDTGRTWAELAELAADPANLPEGMEPGLKAADVWQQAEATVPFGTHVSVVEVDTETGQVRLVRHVACDDCGVILNRVVVDGQVHGGVAQGIGQALWEEVRYDPDANPLTTNLTSYLIPTASSVPSFIVDHTETPSPENPLGAKGIGEAGTIGSTPAVVNAVTDALSHLGVEHLDMPLTAQKVWAATRVG